MTHSDGYVYPYFVLEKAEKPKHEFKPFDKVLVRDGKGYTWLCNFFNFMTIDGFVCVGNKLWKYCIPYEGNEHLVGTTNEPEE